MTAPIRPSLHPCYGGSSITFTVEIHDPALSFWGDIPGEEITLECLIDALERASVGSTVTLTRID
jgi:hypothetical protein